MAGDETPEQRLARIQATGETPEQRLARVQAQPVAPSIHEQYKSGALQRRNTILNRNDMSAATDPDQPMARGGAFQSALETLASGQPGGLGVVAAGRGLTGENAGQAMEQATGDVNQFSQTNPKTATALKLAGALPSAIASGGIRLAGAGVRGAGAVLAGGQALASRLGSTEHPDESFGERVGSAIKDAGVAGAAGYALPFVAGNPILRTTAGGVGGAMLGAKLAPDGYKLQGAGVGALTGAGLVASPSATANVVGKFANRMGASKIGEFANQVSQATGTRGAVNTEVEGIDRLSKPFGLMAGGAAPAAAQKSAQAAEFGARSNALYDIAKRDPAVLDSPEMMTLLKDPDVAKAFDTVQGIRKGSGVPLPRTTNVAGTALDQTGWSPERLARAAKIAKAEGTAAPIGGIEVPDPEALHTVKRIMQDVVDRGQTKESTVSLAEALRVQPKLDQIRTLLHDLSPAYRNADHYYQLGTTGQEAFGAGFGAAEPAMQNPAAAQLGVSDVTGVRGMTRGSPDPAQAQALQQAITEGTAAGAKGQIAQQIAAKGLSGGRAGVLSAPAFRTGNPAFQQRELALGSSPFEHTLADVRAETASGGKSVRPYLPGAKGHLITSALDAVQGIPALNKPGAKRILDQVVADPQAYQGVLQQFDKGKGTIDTFTRLLQSLTGATVGQRP